jgi:hypothetical protein
MKGKYRLSNSLLYLIFLFFLIGCKQKDRTAENIRQLNTSDTFRYEFSVNSKGQFDSGEYTSKLFIEKNLHLQSLEKGFDSIQIRVYYGCVIGQEWRVILINKNKRWSCEVSKMIYYHNEKKAILDSVSRTIEYKIPKSGWNKFFNKLFELKILSLEDNNRIPGFHYDIPTDGCGIGIEIATKGVYRFYSYDNPEMYSDKYWQARNVLDMLRFINKELAIKTDYPNEEEYSEQTTDSTKLPKIQEIELQDIKQDTTKF